MPAAKILNQIADLLDIAQVLRRGIDAAAIDGVLWSLGKTRIGSALVDAWFVRGLAQQVEDVFAHFQSATLPDQGLILTSGLALPRVVVPPRQYRIVPIRDVVAEHAATASLDVVLLHRLMTAPAGERLPKSLPVRFDPYSNTLVITTKSIKPWVIQGKKQIAVVKYLAEQFEKGRNLVSAGDILVAAHGSKDAARGKRVSSIFSGNLDWEDYIAGDGHGQFGFKLD